MAEEKREEPVLEHLVSVNSEGPMNLNEFMRLAVNITEAIAMIHERNIMHNAINPKYVSCFSCLIKRCIMYSAEQDCYKITSFGWASVGCSEKSLRMFDNKGKIPHINSITTLEDLVFLSPEQTGRVNRSIDFRSDIYSLVCVVSLGTNIN